MEKAHYTEAVEWISSVVEWVLNLHNSDYLAQLISQGGILVVVFIVFAETGLLAGFFLPGDSLLITAGVLTSSTAIGGRPLIPLMPLMIATIIAAVVGDQVGFYLGNKSNAMAQVRDRPRLKKFLAEAKDFFAEYGAWAIVIARFVPIMRTFVPFAAGLSSMSYKRFISLNIGSGILWVVSMVLVGHYLGKSRYADQLHKIILIVIFVSVLPVVVTATKRYLPRLLKKNQKN